MQKHIVRLVAPVLIASSLCLGLGVPGASAAAKTKTVSGKVATVTVPSDKLTLKVGTKTDTIYWDAMTKVTLASKTSTIASVKVGEDATVKYTVSGKKWLASSIAIKAGSTT